MTGKTEERDDPFIDHPLVKLVATGMDVEGELHSSPIWKAVREAAEQHEHDWTERYIAADANDVNELIRCKINIYAMRAMENFILQAIQNGKDAEERLAAMETPAEEDHEEEEEAVAM